MNFCHQLAFKALLSSFIWFNLLNRGSSMRISAFLYSVYIVVFVSFHITSPAWSKQRWWIWTDIHNFWSWLVLFWNMISPVFLALFYMLTCIWNKLRNWIFLQPFKIATILVFNWDLTLVAETYIQIISRSTKIY